MADPLDEFEAVLSRQEKRIRDAFSEFLARVRDPAVVAEITRLVEAGNIEAALSIVASHMRAISSAYVASIADAGNAAMASLALELSGSTIGIFFDPSDPAAAAQIQRQSMALIREFADKQREAVRGALSRAFLEGEGTAAMARAFRSAIGLTGSQEAAVSNYERLLRTGNAEALERKLRDRRFDRTVRRAQRENRPLSAEQIERMATRYRERMLAYRAENIARTQALEATSMAREIAARQMLDQTGILPERIERTWLRTADRRTRDHHDSMQGQKRAMGQPFIDGLGQALMFPGDPNAPANTRVNCRCAVVYQIKPA